MRISARRLIALVPVLLGLFVLTCVLAATTPGAPVSTLLGLEMRQGDPSSLITLSHQRDFDVCMSPWNGRYDPDGNMLLYFSKAGPTDLPGYDDAKVTDWLAEVQTVTDPAARVRLHHQA